MILNTREASFKDLDFYQNFEEALLNPLSKNGGLKTLDFKSLRILNLQDNDIIVNFQSKLHNSIDIELENSLKDYYQFSSLILRPFLSYMQEELLNISLEVYKDENNFNDKEPIKYNKISNNLYIQELWRGPTASFKDLAMLPLGQYLSLMQPHDNLLIPIATSGDTGPAALNATKKCNNIKTICLYPKGGTSFIQERQMLSFNNDKNLVLGIKGNFDDAQKKVKSLLHYLNNQSKTALNSINLGRIIFQTVYHFHSSLLVFLREKKFSNIIIPSGNFGNALSAFHAKEMGAPIDKIIIATNENDVLCEFFNKGIYDLRVRKLIKTISPAMDILRSSNIERLLFSMFGYEKTNIWMQSLEKDNCFNLNNTELMTLKNHFISYRCNSEETYEIIKDFANNYHQLVDPHTATALYANNQFNNKNNRVNMVCSTAHWIKFPNVLMHALNLITPENINDPMTQINILSNKFNDHYFDSMLNIINKNNEDNKIIEGILMQDVELLINKFLEDK